MKVNWLRMRSANAELAYFDYEIWSGKDMEYIRYYSTIILWASPFALSGIIRNYDGEFPSKIARTLFHPNNIPYVLKSHLFKLSFPDSSDSISSHSSSKLHSP